MEIVEICQNLGKKRNTDHDFPPPLYFLCFIYMGLLHILDLVSEKKRRCSQMFCEFLVHKNSPEYSDRLVVRVLAPLISE